jgi:L-amino acid N-acyltransferase YncA
MPTSASAPLAAPCSVRAATEADMAALQAIYAFHVEHGQASFEEAAPSLAEMRARRADIVGRGLPYLVAVADGAVLGYAYAGAYRPRRAYRYTVEDSVYIADGARGLGLGRALLSAVIAACEAGPWRQMLAVVACPPDGSGAVSLALHEKLGFRRIGAIEAAGYKFGDWIDTMLLQRTLGPGRATSPESDPER